MRTLLFLPLLLMAAPASAQTLLLTAPGKPDLTLTPTAVAALGPRQTVKAPSRDGTVRTYRGVPLATVVKRLGISTDCSQGAAAQAVTVSSPDGYRAAFGLAELLPEMSAQPPLLADSCDGQPLRAGTGPWLLLVPADKKPTRWVRQVSRIRVTVAD